MIDHVIFLLRLRLARFIEVKVYCRFIEVESLHEKSDCNVFNYYLTELYDRSCHFFVTLATGKVY